MAQRGDLTRLYVALFIITIFQILTRVESEFSCRFQLCDSSRFEDVACWDCGYVPTITDSVLMSNASIFITSNATLDQVSAINCDITVGGNGILWAEQVQLFNGTFVRTIENGTFGGSHKYSTVFSKDATFSGKLQHLNISCERLTIFNSSLLNVDVTNQNYLRFSGVNSFERCKVDHLGTLMEVSQDVGREYALSGSLHLVSKSTLVFLGNVRTWAVSFDFKGDSSGLFVNGDVDIEGPCVFRYAGVQLKIESGTLELHSQVESYWDSPRLNGPGILIFTETVAVISSHLTGNNLPIVATSSHVRFTATGAIQTPWFLSTNCTIWIEEGRPWISSDLMDIRSINLLQGSLTLDASVDSSNFNINGTVTVSKGGSIELNAPRVLLDCDFDGRGEVSSTSTTILTLSPRTVTWNISSLVSKGSTMFTQSVEDGVIYTSKILGHTRPLIVKASISLSYHPQEWNQSFVLIQHSDYKNFQSWEVSGELTCFSGMIGYTNDSVIFYYGSPVFFPTIYPSGFFHGNGNLTVQWKLNSEQHCLNYSVTSYKLFLQNGTGRILLKSSTKDSNFTLQASTLPACRTSRIWVEMRMGTSEKKYPDIYFNTEDLNYFPTNNFNSYVPNRGLSMVNMTNQGFQLQWDFTQTDKDRPPCLIDFRAINITLKERPSMKVVESFTSTYSSSSKFISTVASCTKLHAAASLIFSIRDINFSFETSSSESAGINLYYYPNLQAVILPSTSNIANPKNRSLVEATFSWDNPPTDCKCDTQHQSGSFWRSRHYNSNNTMVISDSLGNDGSVKILDLSPNSTVLIGITAVCVYVHNLKSAEYETDVKWFNYTIPPTPTITTSDPPKTSKKPYIPIDDAVDPNKKGWIAIVGFVVLFLIICGIVGFFVYRRWRRNKQDNEMVPLFDDE